MRHCVVTSTPNLSNAQGPLNPSPPRSRSKPPSVILQDTRPSFCCRFAINSRRGLYYSINLEDLFQSALSSDAPWGSGGQWNIIPEETPKTPRKRQRVLSTVHEEAEELPRLPALFADTQETKTRNEDDDEYQDIQAPLSSEGLEEENLPAVPMTPSRKRKRAPSTPRKRRTQTTTNLAAPTPHSKAALRARASRQRAIAVRPPPQDRIGDLNLMLANVPLDPWLRAMHVLHVASRPEALPCREEEYSRVLRSVEELIEEGSGGCVCRFHPFFLIPLLNPFPPSSL